MQSDSHLKKKQKWTEFLLVWCSNDIKKLIASANSTLLIRFISREHFLVRSKFKPTCWSSIFSQPFNDLTISLKIKLNFQLLDRVPLTHHQQLLSCVQVWSKSKACKILLQMWLKWKKQKITTLYLHISYKHAELARDGVLLYKVL